MTEQRTLKPYDVEIAVDAGRDEVWAAVTRPDRLRQWFGWDYDGLDAEIRHIFVAEATVRAPERMAWADGSSLEISGDDQRARVRVSRGSGSAQPERYDAIEEAWRAFLTQLRFLFRQRPTGQRRTLYLTGEATGKEALSLADGTWERFGPRMAWTVDGNGHLVVVSARLPLDDPAAGPVEVTVSTYGLDDAVFGRCRRKWAKRWTAVAADAVLTTATDRAPNA